MDHPQPVISFDNTEYAFAYKTDQELKKPVSSFPAWDMGAW